MTTATLEIPKTLTASEMEKNPSLWKEFELYEGVPIQMTYAKPEHMIHKCMRYLEYGAKEVWVLFPEEKLLQVYQPDRTAKIFQEGIYEPSYMNGFALDLGKLFRK